jgi:hypothetical protein
MRERILYTQSVNNCSLSELKLTPGNSIIYGDEWRTYHMGDMEYLTVWTFLPMEEPCKCYKKREGF